MSTFESISYEAMVERARALADALGASLPGRGVVEPNAFAAYANTVCEVAELAADAGLAGLHDVARLYSEGLAQWNGHGEERSPATLMPAMRSWPQLVTDYVDNPDSPASAQGLLQHLRTPCLGNLLTDENAEILRAMLNITLETSDHSAALAIPSTRASAETAGDADAVPALTAGLHARPEVAPELTLADAVHALATLTSAKSRGAPGFASDFAQVVERLAAVAADEGCIGLHDVCRLLHESLAVFAEWATPLGESQREVLVAWPRLIRNYLDNPSDEANARALVTHLSHPAFGTRVDAADAQILELLLIEHAVDIPAEELEKIASDGFEPSATPAPAPPRSERSNTPPPRIDAGAHVEDFAALCELEVADDASPNVATPDTLLAAVAELRAVAAAQPENEERYVADYVAALDAVSRLAADVGRTGLHDLCMLLSEELTGGPTGGGTPRLGDQALAALGQWPVAVEGYLSSTGGHAASDVLDALLAHGLLTALSGDDLAILRAMLDVGADARDWVAHDARVADFAALYALDSDDAAADVEEAGEALCDAVEALRRCASQLGDNDNAGLGAYMAALVAVARAAGDAQHTGLHDLCMLLNEQLEIELGNDGLSDAQRKTLASWPARLQSHLASPSQAGAKQLHRTLRERALLPIFGEEDSAILDSMLCTDTGSEIQGPEDLHIADFAALCELEPQDDPGLDEGAREALVGAMTALTDVAEASTVDTTRYLANYALAVDRVGHMAADAHHAGLHDLCMLTKEGLQSRQHDAESLSRNERDALRRWPSTLQNYLVSARRDAVAVLMNAMPETLSAVGADDREVLLEMLVASAPEPGEYEALLPPFALEVDNVVSFEPERSNEAPVPAATDTAPRRPDELSPKARELIELLSGEYARIKEQALEQIAQAAQQGEGAAANVAADGAREALARFASAAAAVGFTGIERACSRICAHIEALASTAQLSRPQLCDKAENVLSAIGAYLSSPASAEATSAIVSGLGDEVWPEPLAPADGAALHALLLSPALEDLEDDSEQRSQVATPEDVSLELPDDVDAELIEGLLQELPAQTAELSSAIQRLASADGSLDDVEVAQRVAHTLKGAGNTVGVRGIATLTHNLEDIFLTLGKHATLPAKALSDAMVRAADCLEAMCETMLGQAPPPADAQVVLQSILDWANRLDRDGGLAAEDDPRGQHARATFADTGAQTPLAAHAPKAEALPSGPVLRVPAALVDNLLRLVGESIILTGQVREGIERADAQTRTMREQYEMLRSLGHELEELIDVKNLQMSPRLQAAADPTFDPLEMEQYSELHTISRRLVEAATDARELGLIVDKQLSELDDFVNRQEHLNRETQEAVLRTRMVPVKSIMSRLERSVRQTCRLTGKEATLSVTGEDTLMDSDVLNELVDPLMHVLRNAVDHGIEEAAARRAAGKEASGLICVDVTREGSTIVMNCRDDGRGMDLEAIAAAAMQRGLLPEAHSSSDAELIRLTLTPNFSTREKITQVSGRGIGLDAVATQVNELGGTLNIHSERGAGCALELRLPVTLTSTHALLVRSLGQVFAVAERGVQQILHRDSGEFRHAATATHFDVGEHSYVLRRLDTLLGASESRASLDASGSILLVAGEGETIAVAVDEALDSRDVVVKGLGPYVPKLSGVTGATILGDGSVTPVLDLQELVRRPVTSAEAMTALEVAEPPPRLPRALVVDDSLSARRSLTQLMHDAGYEVDVARDGMEAAGALEKSVPDVVLTDLEMPRMNGMELARHIRGRAPLAHLPIIMVTSRTTSKHREQAASAGVDVYVTKPFVEDELLDHVAACMAIGDEAIATPH